MSLLRFSMIGHSPSGKTDRWAVEGNEVRLGEVQWYAPWRRYVFGPARAMLVFDALCLREIANYCEGATARHREARRAQARMAQR